MAELFFENTETGKRYQVVGFDPAAGTVTLKGDHAEFVEPYNKERFVKLGYVLRQGA